MRPFFEFTGRKICGIAQADPGFADKFIASYAEKSGYFKSAFKFFATVVARIEFSQGTSNVLAFAANELKTICKNRGTHVESMNTEAYKFLKGQFPSGLSRVSMNKTSSESPAAEA